MSLRLIRNWLCMRRLLGHVEQHKAHVLVGNGGANPHVAQNGFHHAWRKFLRRRVTAPAIGPKALLSLDTHAVGIAQRLNGGAASILLGGSPARFFRENEGYDNQSAKEHRCPSS